MTDEQQAIQAELDELNGTIAGLKKYLSGPALEAALQPLLEKRQRLEARLPAGGGQSAGDRGVVGSSAGGDIFTGDHNRKVEAETYIEHQTIIQPGDSAEVRREKLQKRYLSKLAHRCNLLPLAALGGEESAKEAVSLNEVYISLDTQTRVPLTEAEKKERQKLVPWERPDDRSLAALEAASQHRFLALLGDPGSGKSTFVQQIVAQLAQARLGVVPPLTGWPAQAWPILTLLRDLAPRLAGLPLDQPPTAGQEQQLVAAVTAQWQADLAKLEVGALAADLADILDREALVLVFDGLDEVAEGLRRHVRLAMQAILKSTSTIDRVIITCRIRSYTGPAVLPTFAQHTLAPFDEDKIKNFVGAWYDAQSRLKRLTPEQAVKRAADLQAAALAPALGELAANPMLLTTMAIIHQRETELPRERVRLYDEAVKVLLSRWQRHKEINVSERLQAVLTDQLKMRQVMERLAYEVHQRQSRSQAAAETGQGDLPRLAACGLLEETRYLGDLGLASEFLDYVDQRAGLLQGRGGEEGSKTTTTYTFPHRTFQEYLAGCQMVAGRSGAVSRDYWQRLADGDFWYLAGQLGAEELLFNRRAPEDLLDLAYALCPGHAPTKAAEWRAGVWSGQMAVTLGQTAIEADQGNPDGGRAYLHRLTERLKQSLRITSLKAIERAEAGRALGCLESDDRPGVGLRPDGLPDIVWGEVPAGKFLRGSSKKTDPQARDNETPQGTVDLPAFKIGRYPVTNAQYRAFVAAGGYGLESYWPEAKAAGYWEVGRFKGGLDNQARDRAYDYGHPFNLPNHPVVGVSWYEAVAFCRWLTDKLRGAGELSDQTEITLPSESQWEKAARGDLEGQREDGIYPWGNLIDPERANYVDTGIGTTSAVGCFPGGSSPYGCEEMSGNTWEWCRTKWQDSYKNYRDDNDLEGDARRVLRGGAFSDPAVFARCAIRYASYPFFRNGYHGFRVVCCPHFSNSGR